MPRTPRKPAAKKATPAKKAPTKTAAPAKKAAPAKRTARAALAADEPPYADEPAEPDTADTAALATSAPAETVTSGAEDPSASAPATVPAVGWRTRVTGGDWSAPGRAGLLAVAITVGLAVLVVLSARAAEEPGADVFRDVGLGRWLAYVCSAVGLTYGSSVAAYTEDDGFAQFFSGFGVAFAPLVATLLSMLALWKLSRRGPADDDRAGAAARTAIVFAVGIGLVTAFGRWKVGEDDETVRFVTSPWKALFWAFLVAYVVGWLARSSPRIPDRWREWELPARAAAVGIAAGVLLGFVVVVALAYAGPGDDRVDASEVTSGLPFLAAYGVNFGTTTFGGLSSGRLQIQLTDDGWWPLVSSDIPGGFYLALLVPLVAVVVAALYARRRAEGADLPRVCARMAMPAALLWLALALAAPVRVSGELGFGGGVRLSAGPVLWNVVFVALWFGVVGHLAGKALSRRV